MRLEHGEMICGLRPAKLKTLFRRESFSTPIAMRELDLNEPFASQTLLALHDEGWISWLGTRDFIDRWFVASRGRRLVATKLMKRFPVKEGREIVERVIEKVASINQDPDISHRVTSVRLFGSVLTGREDDLAGDVDLVVDIARRRLPKADMTRIEAIERAGAPSSFDGLQRWFWSERHSFQQIKKVSSRISIHPASDLRAIGAPHRTVYRYDIGREREIPFDAAITSYDPELDDEDDGSADIDRGAKPSDLRLNWPVAPNQSVSVDHVEIGMLRRAQHLWIRGAPLDIIGRAIGLKEAAVQAYLASLSRAAPLVLAFDPSFRTTVGRALPPALGYYINIELRTSHRGIPWVTVRMFTPSNYEAVVRIVGGGRQERRYFGRCDLFYLGDPLIDAALIWYARMKTRLGSFSACLGTGFCPNENRDNADVSILLDFRPLLSPLIEVLKSRLPVLDRGIQPIGTG